MSFHGNEKKIKGEYLCPELFGGPLILSLLPSEFLELPSVRLNIIIFIQSYGKPGAYQTAGELQVRNNFRGRLALTVACKVYRNRLLGRVLLDSASYPVSHTS